MGDDLVDDRTFDFLHEAAIILDLTRTKRQAEELGRFGCQTHFFLFGKAFDMLLKCASEIAFYDFSKR